jgi:hypothetical protein
VILKEVGVRLTVSLALADQRLDGVRRLGAAV